MFQVRIHGRGGQGVVTAAELLSVAAFDDGRHAQAFPSFGSERMGAPVVSFCRIDDRPIRTREPVMEPDALIVQDVTLIHQVDLFAGLAPEAYVLINTSQTLRRARARGTLPTVSSPIGCSPVRPPSSLSSTLGRPLPNAALLGGFAALTGQVSLARSSRPFANVSPARSASATSPPPTPPTVRDPGHRGPIGAELTPVPCCVRLRAPGQWQRRWRAVGPRWSAPIRSPPRPTSSRRSAPW